MWIWGPFIAGLLWSQSPPAAAALERCTLRISAKGIFVDGDPATADQAIAKCKQTSGAVVNVADDAPANAWPKLRSKLESARVKIYMRGVIEDHGVCTANPLARGCLVVIPKACIDNPLANGCH
jgi:hypothetical protein